MSFLPPDRSAEPPATRLGDGADDLEPESGIPRSASGPRGGAPSGAPVADGDGRPAPPPGPFRAPFDAGRQDAGNAGATLPFEPAEPPAAAPAPPGPVFGLGEPAPAPGEPGMPPPGAGMPPPGGGGPPAPWQQPPVPAQARRSGAGRKRRRRLLVEWLVVLAVAAIVAVLLRAFVVQAFYVPSPSMVPTLQVGDRILVVKTTLLTGAIGRGSIVVFKHPEPFPCSAGGEQNIQDLVKRVIGLPGETISSAGNTILIDGKPLKEPGWFRAGLAEVGPTPIIHTTIPKGDYFVMGDNRTDSCDSRSFGPIAGSSIVGQVELIVWRNGHPYFHAF